MNRNSRFGVLMGTSLLVATAAPGVARGADDVAVIARDGSTMLLSQQKSPFVAIHFIPGSTSDIQRHVREFAESAPLEAGVAQWFVLTGGPEATAFESDLKGSGAVLVKDDQGRLAMKLNVKPATHTIVVLGRDGHQVVTLEDPHNFKDFQARADAALRPASVAQYNLPKNSRLALEGYDPVAYFTDAKAIKGDATISSTFRGVEYHFASAAHRALFASDPERYLPTYGGWCATAMGDRGEKVEIDPTNFKVKDARLFLFYKSLFADAKKDWDKHEKAWEPAADSFWKKISGEEAVKPTAK